jgi:hypothetical protein
MSDSISAGEQATFTYATQLSDTCQVTLDLSGPDTADFDLYVNAVEDARLTANQ